MSKTDKEMPIPFPDEIAHLSKTMQILHCALDKAEEDTRRHDKDYKDSKRYLAEYRSEIDPHEIFQTELLLKDTELVGSIAVKAYERIKKTVRSPYFARIDFQAEDETEKEAYYIGRFTFRQSHEILIYDWRAPLAGMFYDYELGSAGYDAPSGRVEGEITRKRQFKIHNGEMEYALESALNIGDEVLQRELSSTSDDKMKTIIATLQREQNVIIRNEKAGTLIIQGVAGSGKTSIALHRIAFLLYRFKDALTAKNIVILSPNQVFSDYISNVLPELGEESIYQMSFEDIAAIQLERVIEFESPEDPLEITDCGRQERMRFKSTLDFIILLDNYISEISDSIFKSVDYCFEEFKAEASWLQRRFCAYQKYPVKKRLAEMASDVLEKFQTENIREEDLPTERTVLKNLNGMLTVKNTLALYQGFYRYIGKSGYLVMKDRKTLEWNDVYPFLYLHAFFEGVKENQRIKHLAVDEMQDYTPIQYEVINQLFHCDKTILGDFGQTVNPYNLNTLDNMRQIYAGETVTELNKSYRSSYEIITFARRILGDDRKPEPVERHGEAPQVVQCREKGAELTWIEVQIAAFEHSGQTSLGIVVKTNRQAEELYEALRKRCEVNLLTPESSHFKNGVTIASVQMSKGLEFDAVLIPFADCVTYQNEYDRNLLYIACTRAMHRLAICYSGELTMLIGEDA